MTTVCIRQPLYLPNLGFFKKIQSSDIFVFLDDIQYGRGDFENRNKIRTSDGFMWLTIPIQNKFGEKLNQAKIVNTENWSKKHRTAIENNYHKAPHFKKYWKDIDLILSKKWEKLIDLNFELIHHFISILGLTTKTVKSSNLKISSTKSARLLDICKELNASIYLSGELGKNYLDEKIFHDEGIKITYEKFQHPTYKQIHGDFLPNMSILDLLFNEGDHSLEIISQAKNA